MKKCLIVVDYQNDFVSGSLGFEKAKEINVPCQTKTLVAGGNDSGAETGVLS